MKNTTLRHYQQIAVDKAILAYNDGHRGFICGDACGLGKTIVALKIAEDIQKKYNLICVVAPAFLKPKWRREIEERCDDNRKYKFAIYSYSDLTDIHILAQAKSMKYDLIIFDEVHAAKSYKAQRTVATLGEKGIHNAAVRLLGLSATMPPNNIGDCYTWLNAAKSSLADKGYEAFCYQYAAYAKRDQYGLKVSGFKPNENWYKYFSPCFIGRTIDDVSNEIPDGLPIDFVVDIPSAIEKAEIKLFGQILDDPDLIQKAIEAAPSFDALTEFRKMQGLAKVHAVIDYTLDAWESGEHKLLIYAYHHEVADKIYTTLIKKKLPVILVTGLNTHPEERDAIVQAANLENEKIIIATIDALREGVDAIGFSMTLFAEIDWRAWAITQAEGRTRRIGQLKVVRWVYFTFSKGVDKMMRQKIKEKTELSKNVRATA